MRSTIPALGALLLLGACGSPPAPPAEPAAPAEAAPPTPAAERLNTLVEDWYEDYLKLYPLSATLSGDHRHDADLGVPDAAHRAAAKALQQRGLDGLADISPDELDADGRITRESFAWARRTELENDRYPGRLLPLDPASNPAVFFAQLGSGTVVQPFDTVRDYERFAVRMTRFPTWVDQAITNMRAGMDQGIVPPRSVVEQLIPQLVAISAARAEQSIFWQPIANMPREFSAPDRAKLMRSYRDVISGAVLPACQRLLNFLRSDYLRRSRADNSLAALPDGDKWYAFLVQAHTTLDIPASEIHERGLAEVARIETEITRLAADAGLPGPAEQLAAALRQGTGIPQARATTDRQPWYEQERQLRGRLSQLFSATADIPLDIRPTEAFRAAFAPASEHVAPAADGSRAGILYINTTPSRATPAYRLSTDFLAEGMPGHLFQLAVAADNNRLPRFRRFGTVSPFSNVPDTTAAHANGWALYAQGLGKELSVHNDPWNRLGRLYVEAWRAALLVVDTGIHSKGWSRQQATSYLLAHTALGTEEIEAAITDCIARPGLALTHKMGELTLRQLRNEAEEALGQRFSLRAFHDVVLNDGLMPLPVLEGKVRDWIASAVTSN